MKIKNFRTNESKDFDFYSEKGIEENFDNDELDAEEEGFMHGYVRAL